MIKKTKKTIDQLADCLAKIVLSFNIPVFYFIEKLKFSMIRQLSLKGNRVVDITARTGIDRRVVTKYLESDVDDGLMQRRVDTVYSELVNFTQKNNKNSLPYMSDDEHSFDYICSSVGKSSITIAATVKELSRLNKIEYDGTTVKIIKNHQGNQNSNIELIEKFKKIADEINSLTMQVYN